MIKKRSLILLLSFLVILFFGLFITNPYGGDQKIFFTAEYYADTSKMPFPDNIVKTWELKPIGNRLFFYSIYKVATMFTSYDNKLSFVFTSLLIYGLFSLFALAIAFFCLRTYLKDKKIDVPIAYLITCLSFFVVSSMVSMQAEHLSLIFLICALAFAICNSKMLQILSGIIITFLFLIKGVTGILGLIVYLALIFEWSKYKSHLIYVFISNAILFIALGLIIYFYYPAIIEDFTFATQLHTNGYFYLQAFRMLFSINFLFAVIVGTPIIIIGFIAFANVLLYLVKKKMTKSVIYLLIIWLISFSVALLQGEGIIYYYSPLIISSVVSIIIFLYKVKQKNIFIKKLNVIFFSASIILIIFYYFKYRMINIVQFRLENNIYSNLDNKYSISTEPNVLFLTDGTANFYFNVRSYDKYFYPLPLERFNGTILRNSNIYIDTYTHILMYKGKYIVCYPHWFKIEEYPKLYKKIQSEYNVVYTSTVGPRNIEIFERKNYES